MALFRLPYLLLCLAVSPHPSDARPPPRSRPVHVRAPRDGQPPARPPSHAAVNPVGAHPRRWRPGIASPAFLPPKTHEVRP